jgi:hypothetical protein
MSEERTVADAGNPPDDDVELNDEFDEPDVGEELDAGDEDSGDEPQIEEEPVERLRERPRSKPGRQERQSAREIRELRERVERAERAAETARQTQQAPRVDPYEQARRDEAERQHVLTLPYEQQGLYWAQKSEQRVAAALQQQRADISDQIERSSWESRCAADPMRQRYADRVEAALATYAPGQARPPREAVYRYLLGEDIDKRRATDGGKQRQQAARRVRSQTTQPANGRSDAPRERGQESGDNSLSALRRRVYGSGRPLW